MSHSVNVIYNRRGSVSLFFSNEDRRIEYEGCEKCYFVLSEEDKNYLIHLLKYEPINEE
jgi:hypothetical protein